MSKGIPRFVDMTQHRALGMDPMSLAGADALARRIEHAWNMCGHPNVKCRLEPMPTFLYRGKPLYAVRSNLVNGVPPHE